MEQFYYQYLLDLGFERKVLPDQVWIRQHGYGFFFLEMKLANNFILSWQPDTRNVEFMLVKKGNVKFRRTIETVEELEMLCKFLKAD